MKVLFLPVLLVACTEPVTPIDPVDDCDTTIPSTWPADGATGVYHRGAVEFTLSEPDDTAVVLAEFAGTQSTRDDGLVVVYTPDEPLAPDTDYTVSLDYCRGTPSISFRTSELGTELSDDLDIVGSVYAADFTHVKYLAGDGVGQIIRAFIGDVLLLQVLQADEDVFQFRVALALEDGADLIQDDCATTALLPLADFSAAPYFDHPAQDVVIDAYGVELNLGAFATSGTVAPDGSWIGGIAVSATLDTREAALMLGLAAEDICELAANVGLECQPCPDGGAYCGTVVLEDMGAEWVDTEVVEVTELGPECDDTAP